jgi:hypothetical protein
MTNKLPEYNEYEPLDCYMCGTTKDLGLINEIHDYVYRQVRCLKCAIEWYKEESD